MKFLPPLRTIRSSCLAALAAIAVPTLPAVTVFIDFGGTNATGNWNGISDVAAGSVGDAIDSMGDTTGISVAITSRFSGTNTNGTTSATAPYPSFATGDSFFGHADEAFGGQPITASSTVEFTGLTIGVPYDFTFYASRTGVGDNRDTRYTLTGAAAGQFVELDAANNVENSVSISGTLPDATGRITLVVSEGAANTNSAGFFYLGATEINFDPIPEPAAPVFLIGVLGLVALRRRR
ncbi:hypothetical protein BH23VER1_BH23VER1_36240 [soil metagenome]